MPDMPDTEENSGGDSVAEQAPELGSEQAADAPSTTVERTAPCECVIRIEAGADYLRSRYEEELTSLQAEVKLPGFRRGKAPIGLVERRMGSALRGDLIASVVSEAYDEAVDEHGLTVVAQTDAPDLEDVSWEPGQPVEFEFKCEVLPEVELQEDQYKGLMIKVPALEPTEELFQNERERFAGQFATWEQVTEGGIDWDDYVEAQVSIADIDWSETAVFSPRSEEIGPFAVEGIKGALTGAKAGDSFEIEAEPVEARLEDRPELKSLAGQKVKLLLTINKVTRRKVPDLDDELAEKIGLSSVGEIDSLVRERLDEAVTRRKDEVARQMVVQQLLENVDMTMPSGLIEKAAVDQQLRMLVRLLRQGVPRKQAEETAFENPVGTQAAVERSLKATFLLRKVAEKERILVTEEEVDSQVRDFASQQGWREDRARAYMEKRGVLRTLRDDMRESKTLGYLLENAEVQEVPPEEFAGWYGSRQADAAEAAQPESED